LPATVFVKKPSKSERILRRDVTTMQQKMSDLDHVPESFLNRNVQKAVKTGV
jgi:hypothetical protein